MAYKYKKSEKNRSEFIRDIAKEVVFYRIMKDRDITTTELKEKFDLTRYAFYKYSIDKEFVDTLKIYGIRMKDNVELFQPHALKRMEVKRSPVVRDMTCHLGTPQARSTKRHRVVIFRDDQGREFRVVTNLRKVFTSLSFITFKRKLLTGELPIDWFSEMMTFLKSYSTFYRISVPKFG